MDQGYVDYETLYKWNLNEMIFKSNATYTTPDYDLKQYPGNVLSDEAIYLRGSGEKYPERLRKVVVCEW